MAAPIQDPGQASRRAGIVELPWEAVRFYGYSWNCFHWGHGAARPYSYIHDGCMPRHHPVFLDHIIAVLHDPRSSIDDMLALHRELPERTRATRRVQGAAAGGSVTIPEGYVNEHAETLRLTVLSQMRQAAVACAEAGQLGQACRIVSALVCVCTEPDAAVDDCLRAVTEHARQRLAVLSRLGARVSADTAAQLLIIPADVPAHVCARVIAPAAPPMLPVADGQAQALPAQDTSIQLPASLA